MHKSRTATLEKPDIPSSSQKLHFLNAILICIAASCAIAGFLVFKTMHMRHGLYLSETYYSFGHVPRESALQHTFIVRNMTFRDMQVVDVGTTCGCTQILMDHKLPFTLKPFQATKLNITLDMRGRVVGTGEDAGIMVKGIDRPIAVSLYAIPDSLPASAQGE